MLKIILISVVVIVAAIVGYASTRPNQFHYERSGVINANAESIFPYLNNFHRGNEWNPYPQKDPAMKKAYSGPESGVGAKMEFNGNNEVGEGALEIMKEVPNSLVETRLTMTRPFNAVNTIQYKLTPEGDGTRFIWAMDGAQPLIGKLIGIFIDCEKMVAGDFTKGIENLKNVVEAESKK